jgi:hypothetical protein
MCFCLIRGLPARLSRWCCWCSLGSIVFCSRGCLDVWCCRMSECSSGASRAPPLGTADDVRERVTDRSDSFLTTVQRRHFLCSVMIPVLLNWPLRQMFAVIALVLQYISGRDCGLLIVVVVVVRASVVALVVVGSNISWWWY